MPELTPPQKSRLETLQLVGTDPQKAIVKTLYEEANGDWTAFADKVTAHADLGAALLDQLKWPNRLGDWSAIANDVRPSPISSLRVRRAASADSERPTEICGQIATRCHGTRPRNRDGQRVDQLLLNL